MAVDDGGSPPAKGFSREQADHPFRRDEDGPCLFVGTGCPSGRYREGASMADTWQRLHYEPSQTVTGYGVAVVGEGGRSTENPDPLDRQSVLEKSC